MSEIMHLRLLNSDEIIGELVETTDNCFMVVRPMVVSEKEDPQTNISTIVLSKYVLFEGDTAIPINKDHVITCTAVLPEIKRYYFNSVEFNNRFSEPVIKKEISRINKIMEGMLKLGDDEPVESTVPIDSTSDESNIRVIFTTHSSNTIH